MLRKQSRNSHGGDFKGCKRIIDVSCVICDLIVSIHCVGNMLERELLAEFCGLVFLVLMLIYHGDL